MPVVETVHRYCDAGFAEPSPDAESLSKQAGLLRELAASADVGPLVVSDASNRYTSLSAARLLLIRREAAVQLQEAFSGAVAAAYQQGLSAGATRMLWSRFRATLRELTTLTLLVLNQLKK